LQAGLILRGFDLPVKNEKAFDVAFDRSRIMLDSLGMEIIPLTNNLRGLGSLFEDSHGTILVSCLALLQKRFPVGLVADSDAYYHMVNPGAFPYGSNSLSDRFLSSNAFTILPDGAGFSRFDKIQALSSWSEAMSNLRVCLGHNPDTRAYNCCKCEKCIRNILAFRVLGLGLPACFEQDVSNSQILRMRYTHPARFEFFSLVVEKARRSGIRASWVQAVRLSILLNRLQLPFRRSELLHRLLSRIK
jgi:hypothetical protein